MEDGVCWFGGGGGRRLDGLSGILGEGCDLVMVRVGGGVEEEMRRNLGRGQGMFRSERNGVG